MSTKTKTGKTNTCRTPTCNATITTRQQLDDPDHGWTWTDKYGWGCPQHPAPGRIHKHVTLVTSWGAEFNYVGGRLLTQNAIDHHAITAGMRPPSSKVEGCTLCEETGIAPRHWASSRCQSGGRPHCTCDTCF